jgi:tetratricopeptide (TPR) repeat protein
MFHETPLAADTLYPEVASEVGARTAALFALVERGLAASCSRQIATLAVVERHLGRIAEEPDAWRRRELLEQVACVFERELRDPHRAMTALFEAYREHPERDAWAELERLAGATGRFAELAEELEQAIPRLPEADRADAWTRLGSLSAEIGATEAALGAFAAALGSSPDHREAHDRRLELLRRLERWSELADALAVLAEREIAPQAARRHVERGAAHERVGDLSAACAAYRDALALDPACDEARRPLESALRCKGDDAGLIVLLGEHLLRAGTDERTALRRELAVLCARVGDRAGAIHHFTELVAAFPGDLDALRALERLYDAEGRVRDQLEVLGAQIDLVADVGERAGLYRKMAGLWMDRLGAAREAEECLEWLVAYGAADDDTYRALARSYRGAGRVRAMIDVMLRHAASADSASTRAEIHAQLGEVYERELRDDERAIEMWERALRELADPRPAHANLARLAARCPNLDSDHAAELLQGAAASGVGDSSTLLALARIRREERRLPAAAQLAGEALGRAHDAGERVRALIELGRCHEELDDHAKAVASYLDALALDPEQSEAREHAADLLWSERRFEALVPLEERLVADARHPRVRQSHLLRLARAANAMCVPVRHDASVAALVELAEDPGCELADCVELSCALGWHALSIGQSQDARRRLEAAAALDPYHRPTHLGLVELEGHRPGALAHLEGVELLPTDHKVLHSLLDACEAEKAWDAALAVLDRLIAVEASPVTRARYHHAAGAICRETLARPDAALGYFQAALADDAMLDRATLAIEELLRERGDLPGLLAFHMQQLGRLGPESGDGRRGERRRIWSSVAELYLDHLGDRDGGVTALEVACELADPGQAVEERARLAALLLEGGPGSHERALTEHHALLRADKTHTPTYRVLERLYRDGGRVERADLCARAADALEGVFPAPGAQPPPRRIARPLDAELWGRLRHPDEDRLLDVLFAAVTPALAAAQARSKRPVPFRKGTIPPSDNRACSRALARVAAAFGMPLPSCYPRPDLTASITFRPRVVGEHLVAELLLGAPLLDTTSEADATVDIAQALAQLRPERFARVLADEAALARVIDAALALAAGGAETPGVAATLVLLRQTLSPTALDQVATVGARLRERGATASQELARGWLTATELTAGRAALLVSNLVTCVRRLEETGARRERVVDVIWSSTTDDFHDTRHLVYASAEAHTARHARAAANVSRRGHG